MKNIKLFFFLAALLLSASCSAEEAHSDGKKSLVGTEWVYHYESTDNIYGRAVTHVGDYTLRFDTDSTGTYMVDSYALVDGTSQSSQSQMGFRYTFDGHRGIISYIFPDDTPSYVRASMPDQPFIYDPAAKTVTCLSWDPDFAAKHGDMVFRQKK